MSTSTLLRQVRPVPVDPGAGRTGRTGRTPAPASASGPVDLRLERGVVTEAAPVLDVRREERVIDGDGRWVVPGLWDQHAHLTQWAQASTWLDLSAARSAAEALAVVRQDLLRGGPPDRWVLGAGHRSAGWSEQPGAAALDAVCGGARVVLVSADCHHGWLSSAAMASLGVPVRDGVVADDEWFPVLARLDEIPEVHASMAGALSTVTRDAARLGVVGVRDMDFGGAHLAWPQRVEAGATSLRVRAGVYPDLLDDAVGRRLRTGEPLGAPGSRAAELVTMGPLKIIADGSLNSRTACCREPYADAVALEHPSGRMLYGDGELLALLARAHENDLDVALHAIGDAAVGHALDAFEASGARGSIEHAQLVGPGDVERMARLGVGASVQPAHLVDDRDVSAQCWPDRLDRCFAYGSMQRAGVVLALGSDAPVAPLDPWLAMAAAVHRSGDERPPWNPGESLTAAQALAASTDGQPTVGVGSRGDLAVLDHDPLAPEESSADVAARLRAVRVAVTLLAGRPTHVGL